MSDFFFYKGIEGCDGMKCERIIHFCRARCAYFSKKEKLHFREREREREREVFGHALLQSLACWQVEKSTECDTSGNSKKQQPNRLRDKVKSKSYSCRCNLSRDLNKALTIRQHRKDTKHRSKQATAQAEADRQKERSRQRGKRERDGWK